MEKIQQLALHFRKIMDDAWGKRKFSQITPFYMFPNECCDLTCDLLAYYLSGYGIRTYPVNGTCRFDDSWHHVWLVTDDKQKIVIDITGDQFIGKIEELKDVESVYVGTEGNVQRVFCRNQKREHITNFTDPYKYKEFGGHSDLRQRTLIKIYDIISPYL